MTVMLTSGRLGYFVPGEGREETAAGSGFEDSAWLDVPIPGDGYRPLIDAGSIPDPFWDQQEGDFAWTEEQEW